MENRAYTFAFLAILVIVCLGAYVAVNALFDPNGDPLIRFGNGTPPAEAALSTPQASRTPTPTNTPFLVILPTIPPSPTRTPVPPTKTATLPPFPTARVLPTNTPTPTAIPASTSTLAPGESPAPTATPTSGQPAGPPTPTPVRGNFAYQPVGGAAVDHTRNCAGQYYIYGMVRDAQNQPLSGIRIRYTTQTVFPPTAVTEAKGYELTVGTSDTEWFVTIVDGSDQPLSPSVSVRTSGIYTDGNCWYLLNWRKN